MTVEDMRSVATDVQVHFDDAVSHFDDIRIELRNAQNRLAEIWGDNTEKQETWNADIENLVHQVNAMEQLISDTGQDLAYEAEQYHIALDREEDGDDD